MDAKITELQDRSLTTSLPKTNAIFVGMKHLTIAWTLYNEFGYEDLNLAAVDGQLRLAVMHLQYIERDYCNKLRDISVAIEERKLDVVTNEKFQEAMNELQEKIYKEFPDIKQKYTDLKKNK